jgi:hypothetical protein
VADNGENLDLDNSMKKLIESENHIKKTNVIYDKESNKQGSMMKTLKMSMNLSNAMSGSVV